MTYTDSELILLAITSGKARWESKTSELCFNGIRYSLSLNDKGLPELYQNCRSKLVEYLNRK